MTVGKKMMLSVGVLVALLVGFGGYSLYTVGTLDDIQNDLADRQAKKLLQVGELNNLAEKMGVAERDLLIGALTNDASEANKSTEDGRKAQASFQKVLAELRPALQTDRGRNLASSLDEDLKKWLPVHERIAGLCAAAKVQEAAQLRKTRSEPLLDELDKVTDDLQKNVEEVLTTTSTSADATVARSRWFAYVLIALSLAVGMIAFFVVRRINTQLRKLAAELGEGADQVASAATQLSSSSQSLAQGSSEQAASLEETSASTEEINSMASKNSENSRGAADLVTQSQQRFVQTNESLDQMVVSMGEINTQSGKIAKIIKVIDEIAFQTNILALNAAVEAARAGEAGMGFAVVADEVRNLAQRSAQAAKDTATLIEESIAKSNDGKTKVDQVAAAIRTITGESAKVMTLVDEVNLGSQEQTRGIEQVSKAIVQMERVTQSTAANAEETASAAEELNAQSATLKDIVEHLTAMVGGAASTLSTRQTQHVAVAAYGKTSRRLPSVGTERPALASRPTKTEDAFPLDGQFNAF